MELTRPSQASTRAGTGKAKTHGQRANTTLKNNTLLN